jgi:hypothetical protein
MPMKPTADKADNWTQLHQETTFMSRNLDRQYSDFVGMAKRVAVDRVTSRRTTT